MIRPLRLRHRRIIPGLLLALGIAVALAWAFPAPSARVDALPPGIADLQGSKRTP